MVEQCYSCNRFFAGKGGLEKHFYKSSFMPGIVYKFENQHVTTFEDNFRFMEVIPFAVYFDLETTCKKKEFYKVRCSEKVMYLVLYCFVVAFHPSLVLDRLTVLRNFNYSFEQLIDIYLLTTEMITYFDPITAKQLPGRVYNKKDYFSLMD